MHSESVRRQLEARRHGAVGDHAQCARWVTRGARARAAPAGEAAASPRRLSERQIRATRYVTTARAAHGAVRQRAVEYRGRSGHLCHDDMT